MISVFSCCYAKFLHTCIFIMVLVIVKGNFCLLVFRLTLGIFNGIYLFLVASIMLFHGA
jgi:hypothetical protein